MDITHDNVCSSMLSCFYSHLLSTGRPISSYNNIISLKYLSQLFQCKEIVSGNHHCVYGEKKMCILNYANTELRDEFR